MLKTLINFSYLSALLFLSLFCHAPSASADKLQGALKEIVTQIESEPGLRVAGERIFMADELIRFYSERDYRPLWSSADQDGRRQIRTALHYFATTDGSGLCAADYHLPFFRELLSHFTIEENYYGLPRLRWSGWYELLLTDALFHYTLHMIEGRVPADSIQEGWNLRKKKVELSRVVNFAFENDELDKVLGDFHPDDENYRALQQALERYRELEALGGWVPLPEGESVRPEMEDLRLPALRTRLLLSGDLAATTDDSWRMSTADSEALRRFQRRHGLYPDGVLGERTLAALNVPVEDRVRQIELNLERWRWLPKTLGRNYLLVNIADFSVSLIDNGETVLSMPVVVGNSFRKTPVFSADMKYLEFAPYWYVPKTILEEDKLPLIRQDPDYIERNHYELIAWDRQTRIDPQEIDWESLEEEDFPGLLRQKPGPWNALGRVKFMLPNSYAVYLHDTNEPHLFGQSNRQFSSGCIRLKRPDELAGYLLQDKGWDADDVAAAMAAEEPRKVYLKKSLPVHVLYWTAWVDENGLVNFREDIYARDHDLLQALIRVPSGCKVHRANLPPTEESDEALRPESLQSAL